MTATKESRVLAEGSGAVFSQMLVERRIGRHEIEGEKIVMSEVDVAKLVRVRAQDKNTTVELTLVDGTNPIKLSLSQARTLAYDILGRAERAELKQRMCLSKG